MWRKASLRMTRVIEIGVLVTEAVRHVAIRPPETTVLDGDQFGMCNGGDSILASTVFVFQSSLAPVMVWYTDRDFSPGHTKVFYSNFLGGSNEALSRVRIRHCFGAVCHSCVRAAEGNGAKCARNFLHVGAELPESSGWRNSRRSCRYRDQLQGPCLRLLPQRKHAAV